jgi:hypothetical protein
MSESSPGPLRLLSFGDGGDQIWGAAIQAGSAATLVVTPQAASAATGAEQVSIEAENGGWRVTAWGLELTFTPVGDGRHEPSAAGDQLCRVQGRVTLPAGERVIDSPGTVSVAADEDPARFDSIRAVTGWFADDRGVALRALRPDEKKGHERDIVAATLFDPDEWMTVTDPRLSTTYRPDERPSAASLELWVGEGDELYPRRAAAEAVALPSEATGERIRLSLTPLLCHAGGLDGAGVYLIAHL